MHAHCFCLREKLFLAQHWGLPALALPCCWAALTSWTVSNWNLLTRLLEHPEGRIFCVCAAFSLLCICAHSVDQQSLFVVSWSLSQTCHSNAVAQHHRFTQLMASSGHSVFVLPFAFSINVIICEISFYQHAASEHLHSFLQAAHCIIGAHAFLWWISFLPVALWFLPGWWVPYNIPRGDSTVLYDESMSLGG